MPAAINPFAMHLTLFLSCRGTLGAQVSTTVSPWESAEMQVLQTSLLAPTLSVNLAPMLSMSNSSIFEGSSIPVSPNEKLNVLKTAEYLDARVMQGRVSALARKQEKAGKSNQFLTQTVPIKCVIRYVVLYAKQFSRRKCGARNHGDSLLISQ